MSDQNPIHRDRGRRDQGGQPYTDAREEFAEQEAMIERAAPDREGEEPALTEDEQRQLEEQGAERRFDEIGKEVRESGQAKGEHDGD